MELSGAPIYKVLFFLGCICLSMVQWILMDIVRQVCSRTSNGSRQGLYFSVQCKRGLFDGSGWRLGRMRVFGGCQRFVFLNPLYCVVVAIIYRWCLLSMSFKVHMKDGFMVVIVWHCQNELSWPVIVKRGMVLKRWKWCWRDELMYCCILSVIQRPYLECVSLWSLFDTANVK